MSGGVGLPAGHMRHPPRPPYQVRGRLCGPPLQGGELFYPLSGGVPRERRGGFAGRPHEAPTPAPVSSTGQALRATPPRRGAFLSPPRRGAAPAAGWVPPGTAQLHNPPTPELTNRRCAGHCLTTGETGTERLAGSVNRADSVSIDSGNGSWCYGSRERAR